MQVLIGFYCVLGRVGFVCPWCGRAAAGQTICLRPPARAAIDGAPSTRSGCGGKPATAAVAAAAEAAEAAAERAESAAGGCSSSLSFRSHSSWSSRSLRYRPCTMSRRTPASVSQRGLQGTGLPRSTLHIVAAAAPGHAAVVAAVATAAAVAACRKPGPNAFACPHGRCAVRSTAERRGSRRRDDGHAGVCRASVDDPAHLRTLGRAHDRGHPPAAR